MVTSSGVAGPALAPETPLAGLRVVELGDDLVAYCGRLLASLGADVVLVEPPPGCDRRRGPAQRRSPGSTRASAPW